MSTRNWAVTLREIRGYLWMWEHFAPEDPHVARALCCCEDMAARPGDTDRRALIRACRAGTDQWWALRERRRAQDFERGDRPGSGPDALAEDCAGIYAMLVEFVGTALLDERRRPEIGQRVEPILIFLRRERQGLREYYEALGHVFLSTAPE